MPLFARVVAREMDFGRMCFLLARFEEPSVMETGHMNGFAKERGR